MTRAAASAQGYIPKQKLHGDHHAAREKKKQKKQKKTITLLVSSFGVLRKRGRCPRRLEELVRAVSVSKATEVKPEQNDTNDCNPCNNEMGKTFSNIRFRLGCD